MRMLFKMYLYLNKGLSHQLLLIDTYLVSSPSITIKKTNIVLSFEAFGSETALKNTAELNLMSLYKETFNSRDNEIVPPNPLIKKVTLPLNFCSLNCMINKK